MKIGDLKMTKLKHNIKLNGEKLQVYKISHQDNKLIKRGDMIKFSEKVLSDIRKNIAMDLSVFLSNTLNTIIPWE